MSDELTPQTPQPSEMELLRAEMRAGFQSVSKRFDEVDKQFDAVDKRFDDVDKRFDEVDRRFGDVDKRFADVDKRFADVDKHLGENDNRFVSLETRITGEAAKTRRHFDVVAESLRADFKVVIDKTIATGQKVDRLIASNAVEHAAFLDAITDHEVRITRLEAAGQDPKSSATDRQT
jgi:septal ring factor EnvC (AmiA/AmiB activator)